MAFKTYQAIKPEKRTYTRTMEKDQRYDSKAWREYSALLRTINTTCAVTLKEFTPANLSVDHIIPVSEGGSFWDKRNHQVLWNRAHSTKTGSERTGKIANSVLNKEGEKIPANWFSRVTAHNFKEQLNSAL